jgi:hypothetical protein
VLISHGRQLFRWVVKGANEPDMMETVTIISHYREEPSIGIPRKKHPRFYEEEQWTLKKKWTI